MTKAILVFGATGKQGGAVITNLIQHDTGFEILAVTRNASSPSAQKLASKSAKIKLVQGDASNAKALFESAKNISSALIWGVFSVQTVGKQEEAQGKAVVDESLKAGVKFLVYSSVDRHGDDSINNPTDVPHFIAKHEVEKHLMEKSKGTDLRWTILRPVAFYDNFTPNFFGKVFATSWKIALEEKPLQVIAVTDIGYFGALAFRKPDEWQGKALSLAGDELSYAELAKIFKEKTDKDVPLTYEFLCSGMMYMVKEFGTMFQWFKTEGYAANIPELRKMHPGLKNFGSWLDTDSEWEKA